MADILDVEHIAPGYSVTTLYDDVTKKIIWKRSQYVEPIIDRNKLMQATFDNHIDRKREGRVVAEIPLEVVMHWKHSEGFDLYKATPQEIRDRLNSPENKFLKTVDKRI